MTYSVESCNRDRLRRNADVSTAPQPHSLVINRGPPTSIVGTSCTPGRHIGCRPHSSRCAEGACATIGSRRVRHRAVEHACFGIHGTDAGAGDYYVRPDIVPNVPIWLADSASPGGRRLNPAAFCQYSGDAAGHVGRNTIRGFPLRQLNVAVSRKVPLAGRAVADIRLEAFNVFNTPSFGPPLWPTCPDQGFGRSLQSYAETPGTGSLPSEDSSPSNNQAARVRFNSLSGSDYDPYQLHTPSQ